MTDNLYNTVKFIHVMSAIVWVGSGILLIVLMARLERAREFETIERLAGVLGRMGKTYFMPLSIVTLVAGIWLVLGWEFWSFSDGWISIGFAGIIASSVLGAVVLSPTAEGIAAAADEHGSNSEQVQVLQEKIKRFSTIDSLILVLVVWAMVYKPFA